MEPSYDPKADLWSLGCVVIEMLNHLTLAKMGVKPNILNLVPFRGDSCFPLSPIGPVQQADQRLVSKDDQLKCILRKMGRLSAEDMHLT